MCAFCLLRGVFCFFFSFSVFSSVLFSLCLYVCLCLCLSVCLCLSLSLFRPLSWNFLGWRGGGGGGGGRQPSRNRFLLFCQAVAISNNSSVIAVPFRACRRWTRPTLTLCWRRSCPSLSGGGAGGEMSVWESAPLKGHSGLKTVSVG